MFNKILVPVDLQRAGQAASLLQAARGLAEQFGSTVHVMTVMPGYGMTIVANYFPAEAKAIARRELQARLDELIARQAGLKATSSVAEGKRAEEILKAARRRKSDLVLIGCQTHGKVQDAVLGSVGTKVAQRADCSVLVVRG